MIVLNTEGVSMEEIEHLRINMPTDEIKKRLFTDFDGLCKDYNIPVGDGLFEMLCEALDKDKK